MISDSYECVYSTHHSRNGEKCSYCHVDDKGGQCSVGRRHEYEVAERDWVWPRLRPTPPQTTGRDVLHLVMERERGR